MLTTGTPVILPTGAPYVNAETGIAHHAGANIPATVISTGPLATRIETARGTQLITRTFDLIEPRG